MNDFMADALPAYCLVVQNIANLIAKSSYAQLLIQSYFSFIKEYV